MSEQYSNLDNRYNGTTNPRRHRMRWLLGTLALIAAVVVALAGVAVIAGKILVSRYAFEPQPVSEEVAVEDEAQVEEEAPPAQPVVDVAPEPVHVRLMSIGDILMHMGVVESGYLEDGLNYDHLFAHIADDVAEADIAILNQETILGGDAFPFSGYPTFNSPQQVGDAEVAVGFDVVLKATNHTLDMGYQGVREELAYWRDQHPEMAVIGMADPDGEDHVCPAGSTSPAGAYVYEKDGLRVALLNYTYWLNGNVDVSYDENVVSCLTEEGVRSDIAWARENADFVVVFPHWGNEYETWPSEQERYWAGIFQEEGVDVVIGGHPHVIQPVEVWGEGDDRMLVVWSVGNYVSTQVNASNMVGGMVKVDFVKDANGTHVGEWSFTPTITQREGYTTNMSAYKIHDYTDELAAQSTIGATDPGAGGSVGWYTDYCAGVLGDAFDWDTLTVHGDLS